MQHLHTNDIRLDMAAVIANVTCDSLFTTKPVLSLLRSSETSLLPCSIYRRCDHMTLPRLISPAAVISSGLRRLYTSIFVTFKIYKQYKSPKYVWSLTLDFNQSSQRLICRLVLSTKKAYRISPGSTSPSPPLTTPPQSPQ